MEIERKFLISTLPDNIQSYTFKKIQQGYISIDPVIRIRHSNSDFFLTCKGEGLLQREEFQVSISKDIYAHLSTKLDFPFLTKTRYLIPYKKYIIELDIFESYLNGLILAEVEFPTLEAANRFIPPNWFSKDVTHDPRFQNNNLCQHTSINHLIDIL